MSIALSLVLFTATPTTRFEPAAFNAPVLSASELQNERGMYMPRRLGSSQSAVDANAVSTFQIQAETNRLTFDNWFANEGTILIINNIIAPQ
jgi:hypothetical protein